MPAHRSEHVPSNSSTERGAPRSIRFRLITLVLTIALPLLAVLSWTASELAGARRSVIEQTRASIAQYVSARVDQTVSGYLGMLAGLAASDDLSNAQFADFERQSRSLAARPSVTRIWAFVRDGSVISAVGKPATEESAKGLDDSELDRVFRGESIVSSVKGEAKDSATIIVAVPVMSGTTVEVGAAIAAEMLVHPLSSTFAEMGMSPRWAAAIVDRNGRYVARSLDADRRLGQIARPELQKAASGEPHSGNFYNVTYEGVAVLNSFRRSPLTGWTTVVAVPAEIVNAPFRNNVILLAAFASAALLLATAGAAIYANRIAEPVRKLGYNALAMAQGAQPVSSRHPIVELVDVEAAFQQAVSSASHLAALVASSGDAIMSMDLDGRILTWNAAAERLFGYPAEEAIGQPKAMLVPHAQLDAFRGQHASIRAGKNVRVETVRKHKDGSEIPVSVDTAPIRRPDGTIIGISSILHDISERQATEEHRKFLMREIAHRSKNQLAIIQSIAGQTAKFVTSTDDFLRQFRSRLQGLSASYSLLLGQNWTGARLNDLLARQLEIFVGWPSAQVRLDGPGIMLSAAATEAIGLALHELATNSMKYGALSVPEGRLVVSWSRITEGADANSWRLRWEERGGPICRKPANSGFGTQVLERLAPASVDGRGVITYDPAGLSWTLIFPASLVLLR